MSKALIRAAEKQGWQVDDSAQHLRWTCPTCGRFLISAKTASDHRSERDHLGRLRRHGFVWQGRTRAHETV